MTYSHQRQNNTNLRIVDHWLTDARVCRSENADARPQDCEIDTVVIHSISLPPGEYGGAHIDALFTNKLDPAGHPYFDCIHELKVSAHLLINRRGALTQYVGFDQRAWHAGESTFQGRERCNDFSIGIELEGTDDSAFEAPQYIALARVITLLRREYSTLHPKHLVGHSDIAPGRKTDPGPGFDWSKLNRLLAFTQYL